jgi:hypothetical protein
LAFATAHEDNIPAPLQLEKSMDLTNNYISITYMFNQPLYGFFYSSQALSDSMYNKVLAGDFKKINPIDTLLSPLFDKNLDCKQDCPNCLNGIIPSSVLSNTNY